MRRRDLLGRICGAPAWWPLLAKAQQSVKLHRIAVVHPVAPPEYIDAAKSTHLWAPFFEGLRQLGFVEGENIKVERYSGAGQADRFSELVERVVATHPDVIFSVSGRLARQFKAATQTIPIVMVVPDPIALGVVSNLAHPGGNITGVTLDPGNEFYAKHLELVRRISPTASKIAYLMPRAGWEHPDLYMPIKKAAIQIGVSLIPALIEPPADEGQFRRLFAMISQENGDAVIVGDFSENGSHRRLIIDLAEKARLPTMYPERLYAEQGGLMSYGVNSSDVWRRAGFDVGQILQGAKPSDIPIYQPTRFELVINLKTARALGLQMPPIILTGADEVIE